MALIIVNLPELTAPVKGDVKIVLAELKTIVKKLSLSELDRKYGGEDWCSEIQASITLAPPSVSFTLKVSDTHDFADLSFDVIKTFEKHWDGLTKAMSNEELIETSEMSGNGAIREVDYEGIKYFLFDNYQNFSEEIKQSKKAILKTNFDSIKNQIPELFKFMAKWFGTDSKELHAITEAKIFCGTCGVAFSKSMLTLLIMPYGNSPDKCPKCNSDKIHYLYRV